MMAISNQFGGVSPEQPTAPVKGSYTVTPSISNSLNEKGMLSEDALLRTLYDAGFTDPKALSQAYAIARTESNGRPAAFNPNRDTGDRSAGMFQINMLGGLGKDRDAKFKRFVKGYETESDLFNPLVSARAAAYMTGQKKGNNKWGSWSRDLTSDRYAAALPSTNAMEKTIAGFQTADKGMDYLTSKKTFFDSPAAAKEGYVAPSEVNLHSGTYQIPKKYRTDPETTGNVGSETKSLGGGYISPKIVPINDSTPISTGNEVENMSLGKISSIGKQFAPVFSGAAIKTRIF
jgi:hypothetical protein